LAHTIPINLIGLVVSGDLGDTTIYQNKNRKMVVFPKDYRQEPTSPARQAQQSRFQTAQQNWKNLSESEKESLEEMARRLSLCATGQNVYISVQLRNDVEGYSTLERQSGITLPDFDFVGWPA